MIKLKNEKIYNSKEVKDVIESYNKTLTDMADNESEIDKAAIKSANDLIEAMDLFMNAAYECPDELLKSRLYLTLSVIHGLSSCALNNYVEEDATGNIRKMVEFLNDLLED